MSTSDPLVPPQRAPRRGRRRPWVVGGVAVAAVVLVALGTHDRPAGLHPTRAAHDATTATAIAPDAGTGAAAVLRPAGPLHAHIENLEQLICDPYTATATRTDGGFEVHVSYPGPANVTVYAETFAEQRSEQHKTLGAQEAGATFTFTGFPLDRIMAISVTETSARGAGTCDVFDRTP